MIKSFKTLEQSAFVAFSYTYSGIFYQDIQNDMLVICFPAFDGERNASFGSIFYGVAEQIDHDFADTLFVTEEF